MLKLVDTVDLQRKNNFNCYWNVNCLILADLEFCEGTSLKLAFYKISNVIVGICI
jgi:hypothetical protein